MHWHTSVIPTNHIQSKVKSKKKTKTCTPQYNQGCKWHLFWTAAQEKCTVQPESRIQLTIEIKTAEIYSTCFSKGFAPLAITSCEFVQLKKYILVKVSVRMSVDHTLLSAIAVEILTRLKIATSWTKIKVIVDSPQRTEHVKWQELSQIKVIAEHLRKTLETKKTKDGKKQFIGFSWIPIIPFIFIYWTIQISFKVCVK